MNSEPGEQRTRRTANPANSEPGERRTRRQRTGGEQIMLRRGFNHLGAFALNLEPGSGTEPRRQAMEISGSSLFGVVGNEPIGLPERG
jgi:hypothetical protein